MMKWWMNSQMIQLCFQMEEIMMQKMRRESELLM